MCHSIKIDAGGGLSFRVADGSVDGVQETDGIELMLGDFGPGFPRGLMVVQDGDNLPETQNFKLFSWMDIVAALNLEAP